ncbi:MAG: hypothetical protein P9L92_19465 [Candidatus Electryonea clarkiae]|nr:hypothetical protein [Candidatus Electryonea clarkiae]MDP8287497.1 hypothetical protein [Candidatus Electryonea clarkiae]
MRSGSNLIVFLIIIIFISSSGPVIANPKIVSVETFWEDSLAVVRPEIIEPFREEIWRALLSGLPIAIDFEIRISRIGYVKRQSYQVIVQHEVWENRFRVVAPVGTITIIDYNALEHYFKNNLGLYVDAHDLPYIGYWFVKVRVGEGRVIRDKGLKQSHGIEPELIGLTAWLFKWGKPKANYSDWSELVRLPDPIKSGKKAK